MNQRSKMKNGKLNGKVAVVTGASKGIGAVQLHAPARGRPKMFTVVFYGSGRTAEEIHTNWHTDIDPATSQQPVDFMI